MTSQELFARVEKLEREAQAAVDTNANMPLIDILRYATQIEVCRYAAKRLQKQEEERTVTE